MANLHAIVMAGGSGTRFWPASRTARPKQFLPLANGRMLLAATIDRLAGLCEPDHIWVVTTARQRRTLARLLPDFRLDRLIVEPEARDTAPCVALAAATIAAHDPAATMVVLPSDHVIEPVAEFHRMIRRGVDLAADDATLVTFGVPPTGPATGFGYVECGAPLDAGSPRAFAARRFREKPDLATAELFLATGGFLWNSGIFVWTVPAIRAAMAVGDPALAAATDRLIAALAKGHRGAATRCFRQMPKNSVDYAVMEKAPHVAVVEAPVHWDDVGSFPALAAVGNRDAAGNITVLGGGATAVALQAGDNVVYAEGPRTVAVFGANDLVVVAVDDAVLVCPKSRAADLKQLVDHLRNTGRTDLL